MQLLRAHFLKLTNDIEPNIKLFHTTAHPTCSQLTEPGRPFEPRVIAILNKGTQRRVAINANERDEKYRHLFRGCV